MKNLGDQPTAEEKQPLLGASAESGPPFDLVALKERAEQTPALDDYDYVELENLPAYMVLLSVVNAIFAVLIVLGAYYFIIASGERITPHCKPYVQPDLPIWSFRKPKIRENMCYISTYCFWTYPILCPLGVIWVNWKNLVDKRLFYECLLNRIFLVQSNVSYLNSVTFWFLIGYGMLALSCMYYMDVGRDSYWKYKEVVFGMLAYISAVGAFLFKLFSQWSVNAQIISITNYVYRDNAKAVDLLNQCRFVTAKDFEIAWLNVEDMLEELQGEELNTSQILLLTLDMHDRWKQREPTFIEKAGVFCSLCMPKRYWVARLLYCRHLTDWRSWRFRFCIRFYVAFMAVSVALFCWGMFYTTSHYLLFQHNDMLPPDLKRLPPPHEAPTVINRVSKLIPKVMKTRRGWS